MFHKDYNTIKKIVKYNNITPIYLSNGKQIPVFDQNMIDIIKKHIEEYRRQI